MFETILHTIHDHAYFLIIVATNFAAQCYKKKRIFLRNLIETSFVHFVAENWRLLAYPSFGDYKPICHSSYMILI